MPLDAPGSLSQKQYLDVTAFILERNGLPPGDVPLSTASLSQVRLSGMRSAAAGSSSNTDEIVRVAPPTRNVYAQLPAGANVNISDSMMLNAGSEENDWLLHGRTYDNQRYSPLKQITAENVRSLTPVALVQTGMTASFETTPIVANGVMYLTTPVTVRFSDAGGLPDLHDASPLANPHGMAMKFHLPSGSDTDIVVNSLKFFTVATPEEFRDLQLAAATSRPGASSRPFSRVIRVSNGLTRRSEFQIASPTCSSIKRADGMMSQPEVDADDRGPLPCGSFRSRSGDHTRSSQLSAEIRHAATIGLRAATGPSA
jgi:hypothetical protein